MATICLSELVGNRNAAVYLASDNYGLARYPYDADLSLPLSAAAYRSKFSAATRRWAHCAAASEGVLQCLPSEWQERKSISGSLRGIAGQGVGCDRRVTGFIGGRFSAEPMQILTKRLSSGL